METFEQIRDKLKEKFEIDIDDFKATMEGSTVKKEDIAKYPLSDLIKGIEVEVEHTSDKMVALEVALTHLNEAENYYTELKKMEKKLDEVISAGSVGTIETPTMVGNHDTIHRNKPAFNLDQGEFRNFIKKKQLPNRVKQFVDGNKNNKIYMLYSGMAFRVDKFFAAESVEEVNKGE